MATSGRQVEALPTASQETSPACSETQTPSGMTETRSTNMTTATQTLVQSQTADMKSIVATALLGLGIILFAGFAQIEAVHNVGHDTRHAFGFACH
jgi:cobalt transporter subunit CbtB